MPSTLPSQKEPLVSFTIHQATTPSDIAKIKTLFTAYTTALNLDLSFQNYSAELASLPGAYAPPKGCLLIARSTTCSPNENSPEQEEEKEEQVLGCIALRPLPPNSQVSSSAPSTSSTPSSSAAALTSSCCELKRLYVCPRGRGTGVGKALITHILSEARKIGYKTVKLDTLTSMTAAIALYEREFGFRRCEAYYATPLAERTVFFELEL